MLASIFVPVVLVLSLAVALRWPRDEMISRRPYNNIHNDATAAREGWLG